ncbi:unnamed protein product [Coregonus sp. 'balchen']|nr:unnamed protein product [Coregonus sp. 'balchen']
MTCQREGKRSSQGQMDLTELIGVPLPPSVSFVTGFEGYPAYSFGPDANVGRLTKSFIPDPFFRDFTVTVTAKPTTRRGGVLFAITDAYQRVVHLGVALSPVEDGSQQVLLYYTDPGVGSTQEAASFKLADLTGRWARFTLTVQGTEVRLYMDCEEYHRVAFQRSPEPLTFEASSGVFVGNAGGTGLDRFVPPESGPSSTPSSMGYATEDSDSRDDELLSLASNRHFSDQDDDTPTWKLSAMRDAKQHGLDHMPKVDECIAELMLYPDEALKDDARCPRLQCRATNIPNTGARQPQTAMQPPPSPQKVRGRGQHSPKRSGQKLNGRGRPIYSAAPDLLGIPLLRPMGGDDPLTRREEVGASAGSEVVCSLRGEKLKLFRLDDKQHACVVCQTSRKNTKHKFCPEDEDALDYKEELKSVMKVLQEKLKVFDAVKLTCDKREKHIRSQAQHTERQIMEEFKSLYRFLRDERTVRIGCAEGGRADKESDDEEED